MSTSLHVSHCCVRHGCHFHDEQCPVFFGHLPQEEPCEECRRTGEGPFTSLPFHEEPLPFQDENDRKTPIPGLIAALTPEQMMDLLIDILDTKDVQERLAEVVTEVLRERLLSHAEEMRRGSYVVLSPDVTDILEEE